MKQSTNLVLNETAKACQTTPDKQQLVYKLTIQKIEYGRLCIKQLATKGMESYRDFDQQLQDAILELGGNPR